MAEKKTSVKYKFGQKELDMGKYIKNLGSNVQSYLEDRRKHGWTDNQVQEFSTAYNRYIDAFKQSMESNDNRFSTDDLGNIIDSQGKFNNIDNDGHFYFQFWNFKDEDLVIHKGDVIGQAIFQKYLLTDDDGAEGERVGGFGSTDKK